jgi:hypothetical protein
MKKIVSILVILLIISCTVSIAYINKPQEEVFQIIGTRSDSTASEELGRTLRAIKAPVKKPEDTIN